MNISDLQSLLTKYTNKELVFIGLGNEYKGDDAAGLMLLDQLKLSLLFSDANFIKAGTNPENYLEKILELNIKAIIFIDTILVGETPGTIKILSSEEVDSLSISTHTFSIKMIENYLKQHQPFEFFYLGIQPHSMKFFDNISDEVLQAINGFFVNTHVHNV
ncbi:MAG: hydrogenase maturation protease [Ignavibacteriales bacterium]|nr:MAG: hydrogenase maturation protease [Ignavibacteriales bacterium]